MGMPITIEVVDPSVSAESINKVFDYFDYVDKKFSLYKETSEISKINLGKIKKSKHSHDMEEVFDLSEKTRLETDGYFDIRKNGKFDTNGLVKGWSIFNASKILSNEGFKNFYIEAGGDIQAIGQNAKNEKWKVGIRNPFNANEVVKVIAISNLGVATSGTYVRGQHIYNPHQANEPIVEILSLTVIGPNVYETDRFATAAFAMGRKGIEFIDKLHGFEGYMIDKDGIATMTENFEKYVVKND